MNVNSVAGRTQLLRNNVYVRTISEWDNKPDPDIAMAEAFLRSDAIAHGLDIVNGDERLVNGWL